MGGRYVGVDILGMFAVIKTGGKQYLVSSGSKLKIEKLEVREGEAVIFDSVLLIADGEEVALGTPLVEGAQVHAQVVTQGRHPKLIVFKYHPKTRYRKMRGHRQPFTEVEVTSIVAQ
mgnify:FL=1